MNFTALLQEKIKKIIEEEYLISDANFIVEHPENDTFGDFATNVAMVISKILKQSPMEIAKNISYKIKNEKNEKMDKAGLNTMGEVFDAIEVADPGFINFKLSNKWLLKLLNEMMGSDNTYGINLRGKSMRIALEHSNVNPNKAVHVGHLRNACIGQFIERSYEKQGFEVDVQYYANDVGVQVATSMMGAEKITHLSPTSYKKFDHYAWDVYAEMESKIQQSEELQKERQTILTKLENPKSPEAIRQKELANKILLEQLKTFRSMGFDYDVIIYESDVLAKKLWEKAFELLKVNPNVYFAKEGRSKGCWLVRLGEKGAESAENTDFDIETDKIIVRSNGIATYTGKDIAYHMWKYGLLDTDFGYKKWATETQEKPLWVTTAIDARSEKDVSFTGVNYVFDVIGVEQTYAIDVVKRSLDFLGFFEQAKNMKHINYGFVFLSRETAQLLGIDVSDGKKFYGMSGRKGWGIKVDDLIAKVDIKLIEDFGNFEAVDTVRNGAIKFSMLKMNTFQDLIFDMSDALDIKGYSGPYVQYAYVRANSVIKKAGIVAGGVLDTAVLDPKERDIIKQLIRFAEIVEKSSVSFAPNLLCEYLFELSKKFNTFYNDLSILNADNKETKKFRLSLCLAVRSVIKEGLWLLGIDAPERM